MADVLEIRDDEFEQKVLQSDKPAILDFWAEWCAPCRQIAPILKQLAAEYGDRVVVAKMDVDSNPATPGRYDVRSIPSVLAFRDGQVVGQIVGAKPKRDFEEMIEKLL